jgi:hypothetical protein
MMRSRITRQRGLTLIGLILIGSLLAFLLFISMRVSVTWIEYLEIKKAISRSLSGATTAGEIRAAFDKTRLVNDVTVLAGADLKIARDEDGGFEVSFAYEKRIPLAGPVYLLIEYAGSDKRRGL